MSKEAKVIEIVADVLEREVEEVTLDTELGEPDWDSLAIVSFMAEADAEFGKALSPSDVGAVKSVRELVDLV